MARASKASKLRVPPLGAAFFVALPTLTMPTCLSYKNDVETVCDSEARSGLSAKSGDALFAWMQKNVATPEGAVLVNELSTKAARDRAIQLRAEAKKVSIAACLLADTFDAQAKADDVKLDWTNLCAQRALLDSGAVALLDIRGAPDDGERLREIKGWVAENAKTSALSPIVDKLGQTAPKDRGAYLRGEANKAGVSPCGLGDALDAPLPSQAKPVFPPNAPQPTFAVVKYDGNKKFAPIISDTLNTDAPAITACYANGLLTNSKLAGKVSLRVTVEAAKASNVKDEGSAVDDKRVVGCIIDVFKNSLFPRMIEKGGDKFSITLSLFTTSTPTQPQTTVPTGHK